MRWVWPWQKEEEEYVPPDDRLCQEECDAIHGLMVAAQIAGEIGETDLSAALVKDAWLIQRRGYAPPSIASVHSLKEHPAAQSPESGKK